MSGEKDVRGPWKVLRILGAGNQKPSVRPQMGRRHQQGFERPLAIFGICPDVGKVGAIMRQRVDRAMHVRIDMTVKRSDVSCAKPGAELITSPPTATAQRQIEITKRR